MAATDGVPAARIDEVPPVGGGMGLPLTLGWADSYADTGGSSAEGRVLLDPELLTNRYVTTSGTGVAPAPNVGDVSSASPSANPNASDMISIDPHMIGATMNLAAPRLNFELGQLELGQIVQQPSRSLFAADSLRSSFPAAKRTIAEVGRYSAHPTRRYSSGRPANFTWNQPAGLNDEASLMTACDIAIGMNGVTDSVGVSTNADWTGGLRIEGIMHYAASDLPSNGFGLSYGDAHDSVFVTGLGSAPIETTQTASTCGLNLGLTGSWSGGVDSQTWSENWSVNLMVRQPSLVSGTTLNSPDGCPLSSSIANENSEVFSSETIQTIAVKDIASDASTTQAIDIHPLGRPDLGNHAIIDSAGLIGYEGNITATAFFSVSRHANKSAGGGSESYPIATDGSTYSGINIQVHSGQTLRRNRMTVAWGSGENPFKYGSDGMGTEPMTAALKTSGVRGTTSFGTTDGNVTNFWTDRIRGSFEKVSVENSATATRLLGDTHDITTKWDSTSALSTRFMADMIPTKVKIVPVLLGYTDETVAVGASKQAVHATATAATFRRPIVDYHVLVSMVKPTGWNATADLTNSEIGDPTSRNSPAPNRLSVDADYSDEECYIYHTIVRLWPTLDQIYFDASDPQATTANLTLTESICENSVIPRHDLGWGLHQIVPFRPLANVTWNKIPKLCATIESGGFYQRGGISHLWDADGYNGELFVGADAIDTTDFATETTKDGNPYFGEFGFGQIWADGDNTPALPKGSELLLFRYTPHDDPYHPALKDTTPADNPLRDAMLAVTTSHDYISGTYDSTLDDTGFTITDDRLLHYRGWEIHEWIFPQMELMRYLGREDKARVTHPAHSSSPSNPVLHPTLHCSALSIMEDGRMMMAAIHRDYISEATDYPSVDIRYPFNPDLNIGGCPAGYYESDGQCLPIANTTDSIPAGSHYDPIVGKIVTAPPPFPTGGTTANHIGGTDNFSLWPTWSKLVANTQARSLVILWSDAQSDDNRVKRSRTTFDLDWVRVADGTSAGQKLARQNWNTEGAWWSGARIAYWYAESGQRAIPITYGSYPESRCSNATLPKSLPHLIGASATVLHGYPMSMMADRVSPSPSGRDGTSRTSLDSWMSDRRNFLNLTRFVPTTIGFSDFGAGANPNQELGRSGWSQPIDLYDPISYGDGTQFFTDKPTAQKQWAGFGNSLAMKGPFGGWSHHGPLHYGCSSLHHPYRTDRVWKQVHGGVGYDLPLHYLIPAGVKVRARAGGSGALDLELELPFNRTETRIVEGGAAFNSGFELGGASPPESTRQTIGQFNLNTNLWDTGRSNTGSALLLGLESYQRIKGPIMSGNDLTAFWSDHPTDHFHAGAMPIQPNTDYDLALVESERYSPVMLGRRDIMHPLDMVATSEQLQSSVEVHVSQSAKPMWDSGSIVTAQGVGLISDDAKSVFAAANRSSMDGATLRTPTQLNANYDNGLGHGQRVLRTPDGTLHIFSLTRSGQTSSSNYPIWTHMKKPLHGDLFYNSKALKTSPSTATYDGTDEVGPLLQSLLSSGTNGRVLGASFASDSDGTIHAIVEIMADKDNTGGERAHRLYYTKASRAFVSSSPEPVYDWDWSSDTPQLINSGLTASPTPAAINGLDLRQPSLVIDEQNNLHLSFVQINATTSVIWYMSKLSEESEFPSFTVATPTDTRIQQISKTMTDTADASMNAASVGPHAVQYCDSPKLALRGDGIPVCFYRGSSPDFTTATRRTDAVYTNLGETASGTNEPTGRISFDSEKAHHALGLGPDTHNSIEALDSVLYYDAIVDERNEAFVVAIKSDNLRHTLVSSFSTDKPLSESYTSTEGLGTTRTLFIGDNTGLRDVRTQRSEVTLTTNGKGELHFIFGFTLKGDDPDRVPAIFRDDTLVVESGIGPLQWPAQPASDLTSTTPATIGPAYKGGYAQPSGYYEWPDGGLTPPPTGSHESDGMLIKHFIEVWMPSFEFDQTIGADHWVVRSTNIRWLSTPSLGYDTTKGWYPLTSSATMAGSEDFAHFAPQLRYQRFWGFDANALDLRWATNEMAWYRTPNPQSRVMWPSESGVTMTPAGGGGSAEGIPSWPSGV